VYLDGVFDMFDWLFNRNKNPNLSAADAKEKSSKEPWVSIVGESIDPEKGIKLELDWNDAFIKYLKANGYTGASEEMIVGKWMVDMHRHLAGKLNEGTKQYE
jgi:hypothetical protein